MAKSQRNKDEELGIYRVGDMKSSILQGTVCQGKNVISINLHRDDLEYINEAMGKDKTHIYYRISIIKKNGKFYLYDFTKDEKGKKVKI